MTAGDPSGPEALGMTWCSNIPAAFGRPAPASLCGSCRGRMQRGLNHSSVGCRGLAAGLQIGDDYLGVPRPRRPLGMTVLALFPAAFGPARRVRVVWGPVSRAQRDLRHSSWDVVALHYHHGASTDRAMTAGSGPEAPRDGCCVYPATSAGRAAPSHGACHPERQSPSFVCGSRGLALPGLPQIAR
jgi:hypothetical protein